MEAGNTSSEARKYKSSTKKILLILALIYFGLVSAVVYYAYTTSPDPCGDGVCNKDENCMSCQRDCSCDPPKKLKTTTTRTASSTSPLQACYDSDGGVNYYINGKQTKGNLGGYDCCKESSGGGPCVQNASYLAEGYCDANGNLAHYIYKCPTWCVEGVCLNNTAATTRIPETPGFTQRCTETDTGSDVFIQGTATQTIIYDSGEVVETIYTEHCMSEDRVMEYFCHTSESTLAGNEYDCTLGCLNGSCIKDTIKRTAGSRLRCKNISCYESDDGKNYGLQGTITLQPHNCAPSITSDSCNPDGTLLEWFCGNGDELSDIYNYEYVMCKGSCVNGACVKDDTQKTTTSIGVGSTCNDSDGGVEGYVQGTVVFGHVGGRYFNVSDDCSNDTVLSEFYCGDDVGYFVGYITCPNGCTDGKCLEGDKPDLVIMNFSYYAPDVPRPDVGNYVGYRLIIFNAGTKPSNGSFYVQSLFNGKFLVGDRYGNSTVINPGSGIIDDGYTYTEVPLEENNRITIKVDTENEIDESNEENNVATVTLVLDMPTGAAQNKTCSDSDGGINYYKKGVVVWGPIGDRYYNSSDGCSDDKTVLSEFKCGEDGYPVVAYYTCPNGCLEGACISSII